MNEYTYIIFDHKGKRLAKLNLGNELVYHQPARLKKL
mgnify:CR=1 FL=1